ncbi:MAG: Ig-like domain-containing protein, partial [Actinobacteria bacterium]|nr:Ig-like domain-containing protein [Actinomycetota bacterium]
MSRIRRFFNRRNSIFGGIATLIVVFGLLFASAPTAQAYSTAVWTEFLSTGGGGGIARADCVVGASGGVIRSFEAERTWALTHFHANCANLNAAGTELGSWQRNLGPYGSERNVNTYGISRCDLEPGGNKVVIGAKVHKDPNGYVIGIEVRCGTLPTGSYYSTRPVLGLTSGNVQDIDCPANQVALGLYVAYGGILDKFGLRCGPVSGADQSSLSITSTTGTFGSPITLQTSGGSGAGSVSYTVSGTGCSITSGSLSKTAAGTCTVTATKAGGTNYDPVSSPATTITFNKANQTISFADPGTKERETTFASGATASSSLTVSIASSTTGVCTTSGLNITTVTTGTCTIVASQSGNGNYNAATDVTRSFTIQDTTPPVMTVSSNPSTLASGASSTITFSSTESTTTFSASDVSATLGTLSSFSGSGTTYTATFTASPTSGGTAVITVASGSFTDSAGNANTSARSGSVTVTNTVASSGGRSNYLSNGASGTGTNGTRYIVERFTSTPVGGTWRVPQGVTAIDLLVVGGGGGGGGRHRGGGGGGGYADITGYAVSPGTNYSVTVGTGGSGSPAGSGGDGTVGNSSSFLLSGNGITANGGAGSNYTTGGASGTATRTGPTNGTVVAMTTSSIAGGTGRVNDCGSWDWCGGGGGGASLEGSNAVSTGGAGGSGRTSTITGTSVTYAGGGGGSSGESDSNTPSNGATAGGSGGSGGGGAGRSATPTISCTTATAGDPGTAELGGGGGAGGYCNRAANGTALFTAAGGAGGSGIVVVRYAVPSVSTPVLHSDDDLGAPLDNITSATTLTFTGSAAVGSTVQLYVDNVASGSTCPASSTTGEWSCDTGVLTSGAKKVKAFSTTLLSDSTVTSESAEMTVTVDTTAPTVSIAANASTLKSGQTSTLTFTLSEASNDFVVGDITVSGGTLSSFTGSGTSYTVVFTPTTNTQSGTGSVSVALGTFTDAAGNSNTASFATTITYDTQAASVSSLSVSSSAGADSTYVAGDSIRVTVNFSEAVTVTGTPTISVLVGSTTRSATYISGSGTSALVFGYTVVAGDTDTDGVSVTLNSLDLGGGTINDAAGNASTLTQVAVAASTSHKVDTTAPTVTIAATSTTLRSSQTSTLTFTLSEASSNFVEGDITFSGGTLSSFTAVSGTSYTVVFTPTTNTQSGSGSISVAVDKFTDAAGNNNTASSATTITYDTQAPSVSIAASVSTLKSGENSTLTFTLSEASTNFVEGDITFSGGTLSSFSGSGTSYTVVFTPTANTQSETGSVSVAADKFTDTAGNNNTASSTTTITYDTRVPTVSNVTSSSTNGTFSVGSTVSIQVVFSEAVTVSGTPRLTLETGSTDRAVDYASGSGTTSLTFTYTVQAGDSATDLDYVGTSSLALNGGSIVDAASNAATLTLPTPGATGSLGENKDIVVTSAPTKVVSVRTPVGTASGAAFTTQPQVSLQDLGSNVVTNDSATVVTATVSDGATLVGTRTATASNGVATFSNLGISGTAGTAYTITYSASYGGSALTVATQSVTPTVGAATQISITTQPVGATAGALLSTQPVVKVLDSGSNVVTTASASIEVSASGGTLGGTTTVSTSSGVATFTDLTFAGTATTNYTLTFAASGYTSQTSSSFSVGVGAAT